MDKETLTVSELIDALTRRAAFVMVHIADDNGGASYSVPLDVLAAALQVAPPPLTPDERKRVPF